MTGVKMTKILFIVYIYMLVKVQFWWIDCFFLKEEEGATTKMMELKNSKT